MWNRVFTVICLLVISGSCYGQTDLVLYDGDGDRIGIWLSTDSGQPNNVEVLTPDGLIMLVDTLEGRLASYLPITWGLSWQSQNCEGQAFIEATSNTIRGGYVLQIGKRTSPIYVTLGWQNTTTYFTAGSTMDERGECLSPAHPSQNIYVPVTRVPAPPGMEFDSETGYFWRKPIVPRIEKPDTIFCNGYESCSAN